MWQCPGPTPNQLHVLNVLPAPPFDGLHVLLVGFDFGQREMKERRGTE
jgi:hypothetical protein